MTTAAQLRKTALSNPDTTVNGSVYLVNDAEFAALEPDKLVRLRLPTAEAADMAAQHDTAEITDDGVTVPIADIGGQALNYWVRRAWIHCAPPELAAQALAADQAVAGGVGDLPRSIGRPATQALANAGITTLDQVAAMSDAELAALHGVGPKALRLLREAIRSE
jgi:hypothetical protein